MLVVHLSSMVVDMTDESVLAMVWLTVWYSGTTLEHDLGRTKCGKRFWITLLV